MRISIVTPSFNQARFLRACVGSVLAQNDPNLEYIVVDGGSTDGSIDVLREFGDRVRWSSRRDRGQADAVNRGLQQCTGEIIGWVNSDDFLEANALAHVRDCFARDRDAAFVYGRAWMIDESGRRLREYPTYRFSRDHLQRKCYICQPATFVRRSAIEQFGLLNEHLDICLDYEWWLRLSERAPFAFCDHVLASSRHYATTKTAARRQRALVEAGYLMRHYFGKASWRWSAKWVVHRAKLRPSNWFVAPWSALHFRRRFDSAKPASTYGARLLASFHQPSSRS